jgi:hypothetical protein
MKMQLGEDVGLSLNKILLFIYVILIINLIKVDAYAQNYFHFGLFDNNYVAVNKINNKDSLCNVVYYDMDSVDFRRDFLLNEEYDIYLHLYSSIDSIHKNRVSFKGTEVFLPNKYNSTQVEVGGLSIVNSQLSNQKFLVIFLYYHNQPSRYSNRCVVVFELTNKTVNHFVYNTLDTDDVEGILSCRGCITDINKDGIIDFLVWEYNKLTYYNVISNKIILKTSKYTIYNKNGVYYYKKLGYK